MKFSKSVKYTNEQKNKIKIYSVKSNQDSCLVQLVASYDTQEDTLGLFYFPGPTGGSSNL